MESLKHETDKNWHASCGQVKEVHDGMVPYIDWNSPKRHVHLQITTINQKEQTIKFKKG